MNVGNEIEGDRRRYGYQDSDSQSFARVRGTSLLRWGSSGRFPTVRTLVDPEVRIIRSAGSVGSEVSTAVLASSHV